MRGPGVRRGPDHPGRRERFREVHHRGDAGRGVRAEPRGRLRPGELFSTRDSPPGAAPALILERGPIRPRWAYFLRADTMHSLYPTWKTIPTPGARSASISLATGRASWRYCAPGSTSPGFYLMDEPDAPLSFTASLGLAALLHDLAREGSQAIVATHSPIIAAVPGAAILELGDWGIRGSRWEDLHIVSAWRRFLAEPDSYFRHLFAD